MSKFKTFLCKEFNKKNISQNKFAQEIGVSSFYLGQLLKGEKGPPSRELQLKIANALNFDEITRAEFFNIIAKEKDDIPSDIYNEIKEYKNWNEIRKKIQK